jgi:bifunctional DNase/RNase
VGEEPIAPEMSFKSRKKRWGDTAVLVEVKIKSLGLDRTNNNPVVILQEEAGERVLPIWIGPGEASAIAMQLADWRFSRPLTHDLLVSVLGGLGGSLDRVIITSVVENTYFAELIIQRNGDVFSVDARPSDSIAVALKMQAKIFADDGLLEQTTIEIADEESVSFDSDSFEDPGLPDVKPKDLEEYLRRLNPEDFGRFTP